jgi:hypothetical protein
MDQRQNSAIYINRNLHEWMKDHCKTNGTSFSNFVESYLVQLRDGDIKPVFHAAAVTKFMMPGKFRPDQKRAASLFISAKLEIWVRQYCEVNSITFGQLVEAFLIKEYKEKKSPDKSAMTASFKTGNQRIVSISLNSDVHEWCQKYCKERAISFSHLVEKQLLNLYSDNNGIYLAPGDHTPPDLKE